MMKAKSVMLLVGLLVCIGLVLAQVALAKEMPQKISISGPGLAENIEIIDDTPTIEALMSMSLEDYTTRTSQAPEGISGEGYLISRFILNPNGDYELLDASRYYRNSSSEAVGGFLYYEGRVNAAPSEWDNKWYTPTAENEAILLSLIDAHESEPAVTQSSLFLTFFRVFATFFAA
jgi:hypothetical protein